MNTARVGASLGAFLVLAIAPAVAIAQTPADDQYLNPTDRIDELVGISGTPDGDGGGPVDLVAASPSGEGGGVSELASTGSDVILLLLLAGVVLFLGVAVRRALLHDNIG